MKRPKHTPCIECGDPVPKGRNGANRKYCITCRDIVLRAGEHTIEEMSYSDKDGQNRYRKIRHHAHESAKKSLPALKCAKCPYDKHVELAHIRAISSFPTDTLLKTVNDPSNLMWLCPNCHWEFDNA